MEILSPCGLLCLINLRLMLDDGELNPKVHSPEHFNKITSSETTVMMNSLIFKVVAPLRVLFPSECFSFWLSVDYSFHLSNTNSFKQRQKRRVGQQLHLCAVAYLTYLVPRVDTFLTPLIRFLRQKTFRGIVPFPASKLTMFASEIWCYPGLGPPQYDRIIFSNNKDQKKNEECEFFFLLFYLVFIIIPEKKINSNTLFHHNSQCDVVDKVSD